MKRTYRVSVEVYITGPEESFDETKMSDYLHDEKNQKDVRNSVVKSLADSGISISDIGHVYVNTILDDEEQARYNAHCEEEDRKYKAREAALDELASEADIKRAYFSISEMPIDRMKEPLAFGIVRFVAEGDEFWGGGESNNFSKTVTDPSMLDAWKAFDDSIEVTGDSHHVFLEGLRTVKNNDGSYTTTFITGS